MSFDSIIGQSLAVELVRRWLDRRTAHPLLFYGPDGVGKRSLALELAKALNCPSGLQGIGAPGRTADSSALTPGRSDAPACEPSCGRCSSCRRIGADNHPDVRRVDLAYQAALRREALEKQLALRIETILEERRRLLQSPVEGAWKVSIIDEAHRLTADAANVLLKILEEPPERTALLLLTPHRDRLFQTVLSRCQPVRFRRLADAEMRQVLKRPELAASLPPAADPGRMIELALGSPGQALRLSREEALDAAREAESLWERRRALTPAEILSRAEGRGRVSRPARAEVERKLVHLLMPAVRELRQGRPGAEAAVRQTERALRQLRQNVQPALVYENLLLQLRKGP